MAIINTNTATQTGPSINLAGQPADTTVIWSDDGTRATLITTGLDKLGATITTLTTIDLSTGATVDSRVLSGSVDSVQYNEDGSRAFVITQTSGTATSSARTTVAVVDTATGLTVGTPITVDGTFDSLYPTSQNLNGTTINRAAIITTVVDSSGRPGTTVTTIDTDTGAVVNSPLVLPGQLSEVQSVHNGRAAYLVTEVKNSSGVTTATIVTLVDTHTGTTMGTTPALGSFDSLQLSRR